MSGRRRTVTLRREAVAKAIEVDESAEKGRNMTLGLLDDICDELVERREVVRVWRGRRGREVGRSWRVAATDDLTGFVGDVTYEAIK